MAGFKPNRTVYKLDFAETEYAGLEVVTRAVTVDELRDILALTAGLDGKDPGAAPAKQADELFTRFAGVLVSWNVITDDDKPVPATREGLGTLEFPFIMSVIKTWIMEMSEAPGPLPGSSPSGATSEEAALDLASSSRNLRSSSTPS